MPVFTGFSGRLRPNLEQLGEISALFGLKFKVLISKYHRLCTTAPGIITNHLTTTPRTMSFKETTLLELDTTASQASATTLGTPLPNALARMMAPSRPSASTSVRDRCRRPEPTYNYKYDPYRLPSDFIDGEYSPYVYGEPLYNDRAVIIANLPRQHTVAGAAMAYDFLSIPAISSECERVFSSCAKQTTAESSRLSGDTLAHQECLSNWHRRGAIELGRCWGAIPLA
jgi:hypothetical protein